MPSLILIKSPGGLTSGQASLILAAISALAGLLIGIRTQPFAPGLFTGLFTALVDLGAGFGLHLRPELISAISAVILSLLAFHTRHSVTPKGRVL